MENVYAHIIAGDIQPVHQERDPHGYICPANSPKDSRAGIIDPQHGEGQSRDPEIGDGIVQYILRSGSIKAFYDKTPAGQSDSHQCQPGGSSQQDKLGGGPPGCLQLFRPVVLGGDNGTAGSEGSHDGYDEKVHFIDKGDPGYGGFPGTGDHQGVQHTYEHGKKLLNDQGDQKFPQILS